MKKSFKIILLVVILLIIVGVVFWAVKFQNKKMPVTSNPAQLTQFNQLPILNNDFRIAYQLNDNSILIAPQIPFDSSAPPESFFQGDGWTLYQKDGIEALNWLETHQLGKDFRANYGVQIEWWGQDLWPSGAAEPKI